MRAPMMLIHTVAAGGGSILHFDGARFRVGPDSAGADPGPACYRRGGPLTVTDANVMVGKLIPDFFPKIFGPGQDQPLDAGVVREKIRGAGDGGAATDARPRRSRTAFMRIAVENMANAIKKISVQRGYDVTRYALNCFGGAGGQHACLVADALGMTKVLIHPFSSLLSAYGMGLADIRANRQQAIEAPLAPGVDAQRRRGRGEARRRKRVDELSRARHRRRAGADRGARASALCRNRHRAAGRVLTASAAASAGGRIELSICRHAGRIRARAQGALRLRRRRPSSSCSKRWRSRRSTTPRSRRSWSRTPPKRPLPPKPPRARASSRGGKWHEARVFRREQLARGDGVAGPAIVIEPHQTIVVEDGWRAELDRENHLVLDARRCRCARQQPDRHQGRSGDARDLQQPVHGDRRADGGGAAEHRLFGQHQGAARLLLRGVRRHRRAGRQCAAHAGASRLHGSRGRDRHSRERGQRSRRATSSPSTRPTTAAPICPTSPYARRCSTTTAREILFWVASRGHHADIGGISPGSMSPERDHDRGGRRLYRQVQAGRSRPLLRGRGLRAAHRRQISGAQSAPEHRRPQGADRRQPEGRAGAAPDGGAVRAAGGRRPICGTCRTTRPRACAASSTGCTIAPSPTRWTRAPGSR